MSQSTTTRNRWYLLPLFVGLLMLGSTIAYEQSEGAGSKFTPLVPDLYEALEVDLSDPNKAVSSLLQGLFQITVGVAAVLAVIMVAIGGVQYMTTDSSFQLSGAKERISGALIGLAIVLLCVLVFNLINDRLTSLELFKLKPPPSANSTTGG